MHYVVSIVYGTSSYSKLLNFVQYVYENAIVD